MSKLLLSILMLACLAGAVFSVVMLVMAAQFLEYGRVVFYLTLGIVCIEAGIITFVKLKRIINRES